MNMPVEKLSQLINESLEGAATPERFGELERELADNDQALDYLAEYLIIYTHLRKPGCVAEATSIVQSQAGGVKPAEPSVKNILARDAVESEKIFFHEIVERDINDSTIRQAIQDAAEKEAVKETALNESQYRRRQLERKEVISFMMKVAAMTMICFSVIWLDRIIMDRSGNQPTQIQAATLSNVFEAVWADENIPYRTGDMLFQDQKLDLVEGVAKIKFNNNAEVILEAPVQVRLESEEVIFLAGGKLTANVPAEAIGFVVRTLEASIVDYGTEFGVYVQKGGMTETHVYQGLVEMRAGSNPVRFDNHQRLVAGEAASVDQGGVVQKQQFKMDLFTRQIPQKDPLPIRVINHSFEVDGNLSMVQRVPTGWKATIPLYAGAENQPWRGNLPGGGYEGEFVGYLNAPRKGIEPEGVRAEIYQDLGARYISGETYTLTVSMGRRQDHDTIYYEIASFTPWKISLADADAGKELADAAGVFHKGQQGVMIDQIVQYTASNDVHGHRIQVRITNNNDLNQDNGAQVIFDNVRLTRTSTEE